MYSQNSNRDLFLSQQWSQVDSQDWNTQISSQELSHRVPSTPSGRAVLPPTPSTSGNQNANLSNSWSGRALSQVVPQHSSHSSTPRANSRENNFFREVRYALHAVLSVMRDLPGKLQEVVLSSSGNRDGSDVLLCENLKKIVEEKMNPMERVISVLEKNDTFFSDNKKSHDLLNSGMEEFQKSLSNHSSEVTKLNGEIKVRTEALKKQFNILRKLCLTESRRTQSILMELKSNNLQNTIEELGKNISADIKNLATISNNILHHLQDKEEEETSTLGQILREITLLKTYIRDLPSIIDSSVQKSLILRERSCPTPLSGRNVRVAGEWVTVPKRQTCYRRQSPVVRVLPQVRTNIRISPKKLTCQESSMDGNENSKFLLDVIDYTSSSKENLQFSVKPQCKEEKSDSESIFATPLMSYKKSFGDNSPHGLKRYREMDNFPSCSLIVRREKAKKFHLGNDVVFSHKPTVRYRP